jgi:hypothetical protein
MLTIVDQNNGTEKHSLYVAAVTKCVNCSVS